MKLKNIFFAGLIAVVGLSGCDEVANPIKPSQIIGVLPTTPPAFINSSDSTGPNTYKQYKMLLEDCTGHLCTNCPLAATDAETVLNSPIGHQVILMEDNIGFDAIPQDTTAGARVGAFLTDYRCMAGNNWCTQFFINAFPWGMVNREGAPNHTFALYLNYVDSCNTIVGRNTSPAVTIDIHDSVWTSPRIMGATFKLNFLKTLSGGSYLLETCIVEDSIEDWQVDNGVFDSTYWKRNTLRGSFDLVGTGTTIPITTAGTSWTSFQTYNFTTGENGKAAGWNMAHCYIVAFVYSSSGNTASPSEVIQTEMIKLE